MTDLSDIAKQIADELTDPAYATRTHGKRSGANAGCKGPLCRKFTRDRVRASYRRNNPEPARPRRGPTDPALDEFLDEIIEAHVAGKKLARAS